MNVEEAARNILVGIKQAGVNFLASLPDINLAQLLQLIQQDSAVTHVPLCREEEGIAGSASVPGLTSSEKSAR